MRYLILILAYIFILTLNVSCDKKTKSAHEPQEVTITGKVINKHHYDPETIAIIINDVATGEQLREVSNLDENGNFEARFERYYPHEVMLKYVSIWNIFTHPGDSIHIVLDAEKMGSNEEVYHALTFSGDAVNENEQLSKFNAWFAPIRKEEKKSRKEESRYSPNQYIEYRDSLRKEYHQLAEAFIDKNKISEPINTWIHSEIEHDYFHNLVYYPRAHRALNNYSKSWEVPVTYYDFFENANLNSGFIVNSNFAKSFINDFFNNFIVNNVHHELKAQSLAADTITSNGKISKLFFVKNIDSLFVDGIIRHTPNKNKQYVLNKYFISKLRHHADTEMFDKYSGLIYKEITEPFLLTNLQSNYEELKQMEKSAPELKSNNIVDTEENAGTEILKHIVSTNKGKVIYIDCWAIWCGPCIAEMPNSRKLMYELKEENVEFVFLCCSSPEAAAREMAENLKLGGTHYFLNYDQTNYIQKELSFSSYPNYILIDKKGNIVESGLVYSPGSDKTKEKIFELVNQK